MASIALSSSALSSCRALASEGEISFSSLAGTYLRPCPLIIKVASLGSSSSSSSIYWFSSMTLAKALTSGSGALTTGIDTAITGADITYVASSSSSFISKSPIESPLLCPSWSSLWFKVWCSSSILGTFLAGSIFSRIYCFSCYRSCSLGLF